MKKLIQISFLLLVVFLISGCSLFDEKTKEYSLEGLHVTMGVDMKEEKNDSFTSYLEGKNYIFTSLREPYESLAVVNLTKDSKLEEYTKLVIENNKINKEVMKKEGLTYFDYDRIIEGNHYYYMAFTFKTDDAFWLINFACLNSEKKTYQDKFIKWAKSIKFD